MAPSRLGRVFRRIEDDFIAYAATAFGLVAVSVGAAWLTGFLQVSDDDFCRITIAQRFAVDPHGDPTGTSWLPAPFWMLGSWLAVFGRGLTSARAFAPVSAMVGLFPWLWALRDRRRDALLGIALAMGVDWCAWLAATPVPEAFVAPIVAAPFVARQDDNPRLFSAFLFVAALARYEAWPMAAAAALLWFARGGRSALAPALVALLGPTLWLLWNHHAHGDALHFLVRVQRYAHAYGAADTSRLEALLVYPRAFVGDGRALALLVSAGFFLGVRSQGPRAPLLGAAALIAFLEVGAVRSGVPTHHPVRALLPLAWLAVPTLATSLRAHGGRGPRTIFPLGAALAVTVSFGRWYAPPGRGADDRRGAVAIGSAARAEGATRLTLRSCSLEHYAAMAAYGAPERVEVAPQRAGGPCPERAPNGSHD